MAECDTDLKGIELRRQVLGDPMGTRTCWHSARRTKRS
jgi:hypothetical protein